ncbi:hypothetical protein ASPBRDRAFT_132287 [Aspergillus brasiliensis CBS 101740]|uniref:BTB domain-containing protein n=1 Tax=Aspergillus brasiliensis (strain CBS 101740 / IMI 381727 / IBT 21946) TaxID=767769 RepID=A0A1L9UB11_ASPBC|nr:hypothetical protein ASPBRDRAFT_132287 [Aspergillus brasiliensis CBS 101740]
MVQINVGANETPFDVHVELLCSCSPYFNSLFGNRTEEPIPSDPICFRDEDPDVFAELLAWVYYGDTPADLPSRAGIPFLLQLWILAGKYEIPRLQNQVIHLCRAAMDKNPSETLSHDNINYVYAHTLPESPLRLLLIDNWAREATQEDVMSRPKSLPYPFLEDLCRALIERKGNTNHAEGEAYYAERYNINHSPLDNNQVHSNPNLPKTATREQLKKRNMKRPSSRLHKASHTSPLGAMAPNIVEENDSKSEVSS